MNLLAITFCVLMVAVSIIAKTERLKPITDNPQKNVKFTYITPTSPIRYTTPELRFPTTPSYDQKPNKSLYNYNYNTDTGIQAQEEGHLNNVDTDREALEVQGNYNYTDNQGNTFHVSYIANENGFQPDGAHLPTVPPLIKKALQYIAEHSEENEKK